MRTNRAKGKYAVVLDGEQCEFGVSVAKDKVLGIEGHHSHPFALYPTLAIPPDPGFAEKLFVV